MRPRLLKRTSWNIKFGKLMPLMPLQFIIVDSTHPNVHVGMHDLAKPIFWFESGDFRAKNRNLLQFP